MNPHNKPPLDSTVSAQPSADLDDPRVIEALDQYAAALEAGAALDREAFLARYPDIAAPLAECLEGMDALHAAGSAPSATADYRPGTPLGDFRIIREIGRGGMGVVYEAEQLSLGRRIALKVLPLVLTLDPRQLQRFKNEARAAAQLHHPHIVPVYSVGCERSVHFYAMQFIDGQSLATLIDEMRRDHGRAGGVSPLMENTTSDSTSHQGANAPRSLAGETLAQWKDSTQRSLRRQDFFRTVAQWGVQAAEALEHAHDYGVIHRDIKPGNVLIDVQGRLWLTDFGLAQFQSDAALTMSGDLLGTLRYMSPEQALAKRGLVDHRTDLYSLGATLYELLTLRPTYDGRDREELLRQIAFEEPRPLRRWDAAIPTDLETIVLKAMAKSIEERYATARDLAADLRRFLENKPILARRPTWVERGRKWVRRHQALVGVSVLLLLVTVMALAASTIFVLHEQENTRRAYEREREKAREADASFRQARAAVDFFTQLIDDDLANKPPPFQALRRKALEASLTYYQGFLNQHHDDPALQAELEASRERVAKLLTELTTLQGFGHIMRLGDPRVLDDLELNDELRERLQGARARFEQQHRELFGASGLLGREEQRERFVQLGRAYETEITALLPSDKIGRLKQIELQQKGPLAFSEPDVIQALGLTEEQQIKIRQLQSFGFGPPFESPFASKGRRGPEWKPPPLPPQDMQEKILGLLTPAQQARWRELTGKPFCHPGHFGGPRGGSFGHGHH